jgi:hypothetical protein
MKNRVLWVAVLLASTVGVSASEFSHRFNDRDHFRRGRIRTQSGAVSPSPKSMATPSLVSSGSSTEVHNVYGLDIEVDPNGTSYVAGWEYVEAGGEGVAWNGWLAKYDQFQVLQSSVVYPDAYFQSLTRDGNGNIYVVGQVINNNEDYDILIAKYTSFLVFVETMTVSGVGNFDSDAWGIDLGPNGDLYVVGTVWGENTDKDVWVARVQNDLSVIKATATYDQPGISSYEDGMGLVFDAEGNLYVVGEVSSAQGGAFVLTYDLQLNQIGAAQMIHQNSDSFWSANKIAVNPGGGFVISGEYYEGNKGSVLWLTKTDDSLAVIRSTTIALSPNDEYATCLAVRENGDIYFSAVSNNNDSAVFNENAEPVKTYGWVGFFSSALDLKSELTFSGTDPIGKNGASGLKIINNSLWVVKVITNTGEPTVTLVSKNPLPADALPPSDQLSSARGYPTMFQPSRGHVKVIFDRLALNSKIQIYSMSGVLVKTLPADEGFAEWDAKNEAGEDVASGVYFVNMTSANGEKRIKIVVQR